MTSRTLIGMGVGLLIGLGWSFLSRQVGST